MVADHKNSTPSNLIEAALKNDEKCVRHFVEEKRVPVTTTNAVGMTAAHIAASNGNRIILKYLIEKDARLVEMKDRWQQTALLMAAGRGALDVVEYLVDTCHANIFQTSHVSHFNSVLHIAAEAGRLEVLKYFVEKKHMDVNTRNSVGQPPVFLAATHDHVHIVEYFVDKTHADLTVTDNEGKTILHMSVTNGYLRVPKFLLDQKRIPINIDHADSLGRTVLNSACRFEHIDFIKYFVEEKHADVNRADSMGWTPLHQVAFIGNLQLVRYLVKHRANFTLADIHGKTVMDLATNPNVTDYLAGLTTAAPNRSRRSCRAPSTLVSSRVFAEGANHLPVQPSTRVTEGTTDGQSARLINLHSFSDSNAHYGTVQIHSSLVLASTLLRLSSYSVKSQPSELPRDRALENIDLLITDAIDSVFSKKFRH